MAYEVTLTTKNLPAIKNALHVYNCPHLGCPSLYMFKHQVLCLLLFVNMTSAMHMKMTKPDFDFC